MFKKFAIAGRIVSITLAIAIVFALDVPVQAAQNDTETNTQCLADMIDADGTEYLFNPNTNQYLPIRNVEKEVAEITKEAGHDYEFERQFEQRRINTTNTSPSVAQGNMEYVPGGVGYGVYYNTDFQYDFSTGTSLMFNISCAKIAGGNVDDFLYLTATNRAAKGVEALISYNKQQPCSFRVFDWSMPESNRWQVTIPYSDLTQYLNNDPFNPAGDPSITVMNQTMQTGTNQWWNCVYLLNWQTNTYDRVYSHRYNATLESQKDSHYGSWGPIVETFQDSYVGTNEFGFYNIQLRSKVSGFGSNEWEGWDLLREDNSYIRNDGKGFTVDFILPNYTFYVSGSDA